MPDALIGCPGCGRGNAEDRPLCLYCGASLRSERAQLRADVERLVPSRRRGGERFMVAVFPGQHDEARVRDLARIFQIDAHSADQILRRPVPVTEELPSETRAAAALQLLRKADIEAVAFGQADLDAVPPCAVPLRVEAPGASRGHPPDGGRELRVAEADGGVRRVSLADLRYGVSGRLVLRTVTREPRPGAPAQTLSEERRSVLDLYGVGGPPLRLIEGLTHVMGLGLTTEQRALAFGLLRTRMSSVRPDLPFDEGHRFDALRAADGHTALGYPYLVAPAIEPRAPARFVVHTTHDWDEWSARAWVIFRRRGAPAR